MFLILAEYKVFGTGFTLGGGMEGWIHLFLQNGTYPWMAPVLASFVLPHAHALAFLVAYGELAIGLSLTLGVMVRPVGVFGFLYMIALLFSSNYPGSHAALWRYFGASLDHSVLALCFAAFAFGRPDELLSVRGLVPTGWLRKS
ncbi:MAG: DoxX family membrane protein [Acidobacteriaceae bacterium]